MTRIKGRVGTRLRALRAALEPDAAGRPGSRGGRGRTARRLPGGWINWALGLVCLVVIAVAVTSIGSSSSGAESAERTAEVGRGVVQSTVSGNGSLEAAEQVELDFGTSGEVTDIYVKAGEQVEKGETLARIDSSSAEASLASAEAQLAEAEETLEAAEEAEVSTTYETTGTTVLASFVAEETNPTQPETVEPEGGEPKQPKGQQEPKEQTEPKGQQEPKQPNESTQEEQSPQGGAGGGSAPAQEAPAEEAAPATGGSSMEGSAAGATVSVETAEASLRQAELSVQSAEQEVKETALRAPFSGTVASISGAVGETVSGEAAAAATTGGGSTESSSAGGIGALLGGGSSSGSSGDSSSSSSSSAFVVLSRLDQLKMEVSFSESDIGKVKVGQSATVSISSMEGVELAGRVTKVDVLPGEGSSGVVEYPATILLTQHAQGLRAGMSASAEVVVEQVTNAITVPSEAITSAPTKSVTVKEDGGEVEKEITTGLVGDETTEVISGVKPGETLVLPEVTIPSGGEAGGEGGFPDFGGGGSIPSFGGGGFPSGFPGGS